MNNALIDEKEIESITVPFIRHEVLLSKSQEEDTFLWLFISLVLLINETKKQDRYIYSENIINEVKELLKNNFNIIFDKNLIDTIEKTIENKYLSETNNNMLDEKKVVSIEKQKPYFEKQMERKYIWQDAITKEILPYFDDIYINIINKNENIIKVENIDKIKPSVKLIKDEYEKHIKIKQFNINEEINSTDEIIDPDAPINFDAEIDADEEKKIKTKESIDVEDSKFKIIFIDSNKKKYNINIDIYVINDQLMFKTPFDDYIPNDWYNKCFQKAVNVNAEIEKIYNRIKQQHIEKGNDGLLQNSKTDFSISLKHCGGIYRLIEGIDKDNTLKSIVLKMETFYSNKFSNFHAESGKLLDKLIKCIYDRKKTSLDDRKKMTSKELFYAKIDLTFRGIDIDYQYFKNENIFKDWKEKKIYLKNEHSKFKADFLDVMFNSKILYSKKIYKDFINDVMEIYNNRNIEDHIDSQYTQTRMNNDLIEKIEKVVQILVENM